MQRSDALECPVKPGPAKPGCQAQTRRLRHIGRGPTVMAACALDSFYRGISYVNF